MLKVGKDASFFDLLEGQATIAVQAAEEFVGLVNDFPNLGKHTANLLRIENDGDEITHSLQNKLSATFIPPLDQEDLSRLSHLLDDVTDCIEAVGARIEMYKLSSARPDLSPFAANLLDATKVTSEAIFHLRTKFKKTNSINEILIKIHSLENESDRLYRAAVTELFDKETDPIAILKWKEVYDRVEFTIDNCESIANVIENMIVKYA